MNVPQKNNAQRSLTVSALTVRVAVVSVGKRSFERVLALRGCQMQGRLGLGQLHSPQCAQVDNAIVVTPD